MRNLITLILVLALSSVTFAASENLLTDGDFSLGTISDVGNKWSISNQDMDTWYGYSSNSGDFYEVTSEGYVTSALTSQSDRLLLQVIEAPDAGDYTFEFDYRLTDSSDMYSVVRVFAIDDDNADFSVDTKKWNGSFSKATSATAIYDQGGYYSSLPNASQWTTVSSTVTVTEATDYLVTFAAFSRDGSQNSLINEFSDLDNFSLTSASPEIPEPASIAILGLGSMFLAKAPKH